MLQIIKNLFFVQLERGAVEVESHSSQTPAVIGECGEAFAADGNIAIHFFVQIIESGDIFSCPIN